MKSNKLLAQLGLVVGLAQASGSNPAPTVDLGYSLHRGTIEVKRFHAKLHTSFLSHFIV